MPIWRSWQATFLKGTTFLHGTQNLASTALISSISDPVYRSFHDTFSEALSELKLTRYCCRRMLLTHVDLIEKLYVLPLASIHFLLPLIPFHASIISLLTNSLYECELDVKVELQHPRNQTGQLNLPPSASIYSIWIHFPHVQMNHSTSIPIIQALARYPLFCCQYGR